MNSDDVSRLKFYSLQHSNYERRRNIVIIIELECECLHFTALS